MLPSTDAYIRVEGAATCATKIVAANVASSGVLISSTIGSSHAVVPSDPPAGNGATKFNLEVGFAVGDLMVSSRR